MKTLLALVATKGSFDGPWQRSKGLEHNVIVEKLGEGEVITMNYQVDGALKQIKLDSSGNFPFPVCQRFQFCKTSELLNSPETNVKIGIGD